MFRLGRAAMLCLGLLGVINLWAAPSWAGKQDNTLNVAFEKELESLDRYFNTAREGIVVARHAYDNLLWRDPRSMAFKGLLATSWNWVDNVTLDLKLRQGVTFHNGSPFSADDVVYMLNWVSDPDNKVKQQRYVNWIRKVEKTGAHQVRIHLKKPFPAALEFLAMANPIYPRDYYAKAGPRGFGIKPIGTGPYKIVEVQPGKKIVFEKNPDYFKGSPKGQPAIKRIVWRTLPEVNTKVAELMTGALDWIWLVPRDQAARLKEVPGIEVVAAETMRIGFVMMDAADRTGKEHGMHNPFAQQKVRQAVNHAINRQSISRNLVGGQSRVVHSACFPTQFGCTQDVRKYKYDPARAKQLLAAAGYPDGFTFDLYAYRDRPYAEAMVGDLKKVGITAKLNMLKYSALREKIWAGKVQAAFYTWGSYSINDISAITSYYFQFEKSDMTRDPRVRDWLVEGDNTIDSQRRQEVYTRALQRIAEQAYWTPLFTWVSNNCFRADLDFTPHPDAVPRFYMAQWK